MPQFMGYDPTGKPIYAQPTMPQGYPQMPNMQPQTAQSVQPAAQPVQPTVQPVQPAQPAQPNADGLYRMVPPEAQKALADQYKPELPKEQGARVSKIAVKHEAEEMPPMMRTAISNSAIKRAEMEQQMQQEAAERATRPLDVHVSKIVHDAAEMPTMIRNAMEKAAVTPQENIFDQQARPVAEPVMENIEDILHSIGEDTSQFKKQKKTNPNDAAAANIQYEEYKPKNSRSSRKKSGSSSAASSRPLTKEELRDQKRREKIDAQFKKDLAKRGF